MQPGKPIVVPALRIAIRETESSDYFADDDTIQNHLVRQIDV